MVDSQEFSQILQEPINQDNYLGLWDKNKTYPSGYIISYGDKNYESITDVPAGIYPPNPIYWKLSSEQNLKDILATYNKNLDINNAALQEAARIVPLAGYNRSSLYITPTYGEYESNGVLSGKDGQPAPPINLVTSSSGGPTTGTVAMIRNPNYRIASPAVIISNQALQSIWDITVDAINVSTQINLEVLQLAPKRIGNNSGQVEGDMILSVESTGPVTGPYGTSDNTYATGDQNPVAPGFTGTVTQQMDYRADCDPAFQYISRSSPITFGYSAGYLTGTAVAPNGYPVGTGISFPQNPQVGDYFLRIDYLPQLLYRWNGKLWIRISENVRTDTGFTAEDRSLLSGFINDSNVTRLINGTVIPEAQPLSSILQPPLDPIPPIP
jgi:hypothetical protein